MRDDTKKSECNTKKYPTILKPNYCYTIITYKNCGYYMDTYNVFYFRFYYKHKSGKFN